MAATLIFYFSTFFCILCAFTVSSILLFQGVQERKDASNRILNEVQAIVKKLENSPEAKKRAQPKSIPKNRPHLDHSLANLLTFDPFLEKTAPKISSKEELSFAIFGSTENLHPFHQKKPLQNLCVGKIAEPHVENPLSFSPEIATKIEQRPGFRHDIQAFWIHLREGVYWQKLRADFFGNAIELSEHFLQKHPVTSYDFALYLQAIKNPYVNFPQAVRLRTLLQDIEKVEVIDDLTFVVYFKMKKHQDLLQRTTYLLPVDALKNICNLQPLPCFVYKYNPDGSKICTSDLEPLFYEKSKEWADAFTNHFAQQAIISCGPLLFDRIDSSGIHLRKNHENILPRKTHYERITLNMHADTMSPIKKLISGSLDMHSVRSYQTPTVQKLISSKEYRLMRKKGYYLKQMDHLMNGYVYVGWNTSNVLFSHKNVRKAMSLSINCLKHIQKDLSAQAISITGPFPYGSTEYNNKMYSFGYNPQEAKHLLTREGWMQHKSVLMKYEKGKSLLFRFKLLYNKDDALLAITAKRIASDLKKIGIICNPKGMKAHEVENALYEKDFDAVLAIRSYDENPFDPTFIWHSQTAKELGSENFVNFGNTQVDLICEELKFTHDPNERTQLTHKLHKLLYDEAPYTFLYVPKMKLFYWNTVQNIFISPKQNSSIHIPRYDHSWKKP